MNLRSERTLSRPMLRTVTPRSRSARSDTRASSRAGREGRFVTNVRTWDSTSPTSSASRLTTAPRREGVGVLVDVSTAEASTALAADLVSAGLPLCELRPEGRGLAEVVHDLLAGDERAGTQWLPSSSGPRCDEPCGPARLALPSSCP